MNRTFIKKSLLILVLLTSLANSALAQKRNNVFIDFCGVGTPSIGVTYDTRFGKETKWGGRVGLSYTLTTNDNFLDTDPTKVMGVNIPIAVNYLVGNKINNFEVGLGFNYNIYHAQYKYKLIDPKPSENLNGLSTFLDLGYRYQAPNGGVMFRIGLSPSMPLEHFHSSLSKDREVGRQIIISIYASVGINF